MPLQIGGDQAAALAAVARLEASAAAQSPRSSAVMSPIVSPAGTAEPAGCTPPHTTPPATMAKALIAGAWHLAHASSAGA